MFTSLVIVCILISLWFKGGTLALLADSVITGNWDYSKRWKGDLLLALITGPFLIFVIWWLNSGDRRD